MDINSLPVPERDRISKLIEAKQAQQFMSLYSTVVETCFSDCINDFTSEALAAKESDCVKRCTSKYLKLTNRIGQQMAEKQMEQNPQ